MKLRRSYSEISYSGCNINVPLMLLQEQTAVLDVKQEVHLSAPD